MISEEQDERMKFESRICEQKILLPVKHSDYISALAFMSDVYQLITAGADEILNYCNQDGEIVHTIHNLKRKINYIIPIQRPKSLYRSTLNASKVKKNL